METGYQCGIAYLELHVKNCRLALVARVISQRYLCRIFQQLDDDVTPSVTMATSSSSAAAAILAQHTLCLMAK